MLYDYMARITIVLEDLPDGTFRVTCRGLAGESETPAVELAKAFLSACMSEAISIKATQDNEDQNLS